MKKTPGDINILYIYILNKYHMMHDSWNVRHNRQFLSFRTIFCPFTTLTTQKIKILKNWKKDLEILSFYTCVPWMTITSYIIVPRTWSAINISFYHFGWFFNNPDNQNFEMKKTSGDIIFLHKYTINKNHMMYDSWDTEHKRQFFCHFGSFFALLPP